MTKRATIADIIHEFCDLSGRACINADGHDLEMDVWVNVNDDVIGQAIVDLENGQRFAVRVFALPDGSPFTPEDA